jgi:hypothetical protein
MSIIKKLLILTLTISLLITSLIFTKVNDTDVITNKSVLDLCDFVNVNKNSQNCLRSVIKYAIDRNSYKDLVVELDKAEAKYAKFFGLCHEVTHALGGYAVEKYKDVTALIADTTYDTCGGGMSHGALVSYLAKPNISEANVNLLVEACLLSAKSASCSHGIGHAFATTDTTQKALNHCMNSSFAYASKDKNIKGDSFAHSCNYGVMMEKYAPFGSINKEFSIKNKTEAAAACETFYRNNFTDKMYDLEKNSLLISLYNGCASGVGFSYGSEIISKLMGDYIDIDDFAQTLEYIENCTRLSNIGAEYSLKYNSTGIEDSGSSASEDDKYMYFFGCQTQTMLNTTSYTFRNLDSIDESAAKDILIKYKELCSNFANQLKNDKYEITIRDFYKKLDFNKACNIAATLNKAEPVKERYLQLVSLL